MIRTDFPEMVTKKQIENALGYVPAGGENLIAGIGIRSEIIPSGNTFASRAFSLTKTLKQKEIYTASADIEITAGSFEEVSLLLRSSKEDSNQSNVVTTKIQNGKIVATVIPLYDKADQLWIYAGIAGQTANNGIRISHAKLEPGTVTDPVWTPSPQDLVVKSELGDLFGCKMIRWIIQQEIKANESIVYQGNNIPYNKIISLSVITRNTNDGYDWGTAKSDLSNKIAYIPSTSSKNCYITIVIIYKE